MSKPVMIYHVPYRLNYEATAASGIRPVKMRLAFEAIGYEVLEVAGTSKERKAQIAHIKQRVREGLTVDFVYSESSTQPNAFTDPYFSLPAFFDNNFLAWCRRRRIPVGLFYRDIYWRFAEYRHSIGWFYATALRCFYLLDLWGYRRGVTKLYVPSMRMAEFVPLVPRSRCEALPPASDPVESPSPKNPSFFYVGGLGSHYRLHEAVRAVGRVKGAHLTLCTPEKQWAGERASYEDALSKNVDIVHASGAALEQFYAQSSMGCLFLEPIGYREFAAPFKLYEYLGHGKAIVATQGTLAGTFVEENGIGWALPYTADALEQLLTRLAAHPDELAAVLVRAREYRENHTWAARARQVRDGLLGRQ